VSPPHELTWSGNGAPSIDAEVPAYLQSLGLPGLVDVHTHFMPRSVQEKVWAVFDRAQEVYGRAWPVVYRADEEARVGQLRALGVRRFTSMLYAHKPGMAAWLNAWAADFAARTPDCTHTATFYPEPDAPGYVEQALAAGAGAFKVHVQVGAFDPRDPLLRPVWGRLAEAGVPVVVHCGSGPRPGHFTGPGIFAEVLAAHPRLVAVIAHMGLPEYSEFLDLAERYPGVHLDTTMAFTDFIEATAPFPAEELTRLQALGERVVLGSDFPTIPYPYAHQLEALHRLDLGKDWLRAVLWDNGARLLEASAPG
jgi:predicted TIM-barrel fold metal-dependent hydrolase